MENRKEFTLKEINLLKRNYPPLGAKSCAKMLNRTEASVMNKAARLGLKSKVSGKQASAVNTNFFGRKTLIECYWAGFIAADGYIASSQKRNNRITIHISKKDEILLRQFKNCIDYKGKIYNLDNGKYVKINITSKKLCETLKNNFNITTKKSLTLKPPIGLTDNQKLAFIKGYIDGDGCIRFAGKYKQLLLKIVGSKFLISWIKKELDRITKTKVNIHKEENIFVYVVCGNVKAKNILHKINKSVNLGLERKWQKLNQ